MLFIPKRYIFYTVKFGFDNNEDISEYLDFSKARRPGREQKRVNVDFPVWMIQSLDKEADRLGIARQAVIKTWIADRLELIHS